MSCTSNAAINARLVSGEKTWTPKAWAPPYALFNTLFLTTDWVKVAGATFAETLTP